MKRFEFSSADFLKTAGLLVLAYLASTFLSPLSDVSSSSALIFVLAVFLISRITRGYLYGLIASFVGMF